MTELDKILPKNGGWQNLTITIVLIHNFKTVPVLVPNVSALTST